MTDANLAQRLLRRWYLLAPGVVASVALGNLGAQLTPPVYQATGTVLLLPPQERSVDGWVDDDEPSNPLVQGGFSGSGALVIERVNSQDTQERILAKHPEATYIAAGDESLRGPVVTFTVTDSTPRGALSTVDDLFAVVPSALDRLQSGVDIAPRYAVTSTPLRSDTRATEITSNTTRARIAGLGAGLILTLVGATSVDALLRRREARLSRRREAAAR